MTQHKSSIAAPSDGTSISAAALAATGTVVAELGVYGLVWFDAALVVRTRFGPLVEFIAIGEPVTSSVPPLIGLEEELTAIRHSGRGVLELPAVAMISADGTAPRLNFTAFWMTSAERFLLLVYRASSRSDVEVELTRQVRGRLIAEAELQETSQRLARANAELEIANRDLEQYAAIISHDLKAPLRALRYLTDDVDRAIEEGRPRDAMAANVSIRQQSAHMSRMMSALLDYASVGRKSDVLAEVDTRLMIEGIVASPSRQTHLRIDIIGDWPALATLEAPLDLVLRNLIDNAIKHHDRAEGAILVATGDPPRDDARFIRFSVSDDGPGIPEAARDAVFLPFRTLGGTSSGTGMGLALVKRTLENVGGSIDVRSRERDGRGATFDVLWPRSILIQSEAASAP